MKTILLSILMGCLVLGVYAETPRTPLTISLIDLDQLYLTNPKALLNADITITKVGITTKTMGPRGYVVGMLFDGTTQFSSLKVWNVDGKKLAPFLKAIGTYSTKTIAHVRADEGWFGDLLSENLIPLEGFSITLDEAPVNDEKPAAGSADPKQGN